jgi:hypothetical protein
MVGCQVLMATTRRHGQSISNGGLSPNLYGMAQTRASLPVALSKPYIGHVWITMDYHNLTNIF